VAPALQNGNVSPFGFYAIATTAVKTLLKRCTAFVRPLWGIVAYLLA
jgi:hypothetical protein